MEIKQFIDTMELLSTKSNGKNGKSVLSDRPDRNGDENMISEEQYHHQLQKLKVQNAKLMQLIELQNKKLAEGVESKNKYMSILAHDLRSPFNSILGSLNHILENAELQDIEILKKHLHIAIHSTKKTLNLLDNLLAWIIIQLQEENFNPVKVNLHRLLMEESQNVAVMTDLKRIQMKQCVAKDLTITADVQMLKSVVRNLISNAIKFTEINGTITLRALANSNYVEIAVEDNGIGIPLKVQKELFQTDPIHAVVGKNKNGTGLGLLICKDFVEKHDGNIWLESQPGTGTKFIITLPHRP